MSQPQKDETASAPMLRRFTDLSSYTIGATDGDIGAVDDLYFDDLSWTVRYFVADTGGWLSGRKVLLSPAAAPGLRPDRQARPYRADAPKGRGESLHRYPEAGLTPSRD